MITSLKKVIPLSILALCLLFLSTLLFSDQPHFPAVNAAPLAWSSLDTFDTLSSGNIDGKNGWTTNGGIVVADPENGSNQVLAMTGVDHYARKSFPASISNNGNGTLFFRLYQTGTVNGFAGGSDNPSASDWPDYEMQIGTDENINGAGRWRVRDGSQFIGIPGDPGFIDGEWVCVWLVADTSSDIFRIFAQGGGYTSQTALLRNGGLDDFAFRNGSSSTALNTFLSRVSDDNAGTLYVDDIYVDAGGTNTTLPSGVSCPAAGSGTPNPVTNWQLVDTFSGYNNVLDGQGGWTASGANVVADPKDPFNRVLAVSGDERTAYKLFPDNGTGNRGIPNGGSGTIYFRLYRSGQINGFGGGSDFSNPDFFDDYEVQFGSNGDNNSTTFTARDGGAFRQGGLFMEDAWHCVWLTVDHAQDEFRIDVKGGNYENRTRLTPGGFSVLDFRNGSTASLSTFFLLTGPGASGTMYIDDIFINPGVEDLSQAGGSCLEVIAVPTTVTPTDTPTYTPTPTRTPTYTPTPTSTTTPGGGTPAPGNVDLTIQSMRFTLESNGSCLRPDDSTALGLRVTVVNNGSEAAGSFAVQAGSQSININGLLPQATTSLFFPDFSTSGTVTAIVDPTNEVAESDETNNVRSELVPVPTLPLPCTPTPTITITPSATSTPTPTATPDGGGDNTSNALKPSLFVSFFGNRFKPSPGGGSSTPPTPTPTYTPAPSPACLDQDTLFNDTSLAAAQNGAICLNTIIRGSLDDTDKDDYYLLELDATKQVEVKVSNALSDLVFNLTLYDVNGKIIEHKGELKVGSKTITQNLSVGQYLIGIVHHSGSGSYDLNAKVD